MRKHFAFPPIENVSSWTDTSGNILEAANGQEGEARASETSVSRQGIERRNAFLQGPERAPRASRDTDDPQEAERLPQLDSRAAMREGASKMFVQRDAEEKEGDTVSRASFERRFNFSGKGSRPNDGVNLQKHAGFVSAQSSKAASLRSDSVVLDKEGHTSIDSHVASSSNVQDRETNDFPHGFRAAGSQGAPVAARAVNPDREETLDLVLDILADHGVEAPVSELATQVVDLASRLRSEIRASRNAPLQSSQAEEAKQFNTVVQHGRAAVTDDSSGRLSSDLQMVMDHAVSTEWKADPSLQERAGVWALHVAAKRTGMSAKSLQAGFKSKGLQALGRMALQVLSSTQASQRRGDAHVRSDPAAAAHVRGVATQNAQAKSRLGDQHWKQDDEASRLAAAEPITKQSVRAALKDLTAFFREDMTQTDMQTMQNGLELDTTADELFDAFLETLRDDGLDEASSGSRVDAFQRQQAVAEGSEQRERRRAPDALRSAQDAQVVHGRADSGHTVRFREDVNGSVQGGVSGSQTASSGSLRFRAMDTNSIAAAVLGGEWAEESQETLRSHEVVERLEFA